MDMTHTLCSSLLLAALATIPAAPAVAQPGGLTKTFTVGALRGLGAIDAGMDADDRADDLYDEGREAIEEGRYDRAVDRFNRLIDLKTTRTDAALYWKAYSLAKLGQRDEALTTLADLQKRFADSRWLKDARALDVEVRQASGQTVSPASQEDDELKLMALRGIMQSDPEQAFPIIEKMLTGTNSLKVKDR